MLTELRIQNFKSWSDTTPMRMAPLTGFFGTNSSGKTAIVQLLLILKQTGEAVDRQRVLEIGDKRTYDLGRFSDILHQHQIPGTLSFSLHWTFPQPLLIPDPEGQPHDLLFSISALGLAATIAGERTRMWVEQFAYNFSANGRNYQFGMRATAAPPTTDELNYDLIARGYEIKRNRGRAWPLSAPIKSYGFPDKVNAYYQNASFLSDLVLAFEEFLQRVYYLGPLRDYPRRNYGWMGDKPQDVGQKGELAISAILASRVENSDVEQRVAGWLRELGLIDELKIEPLGNLPDVNRGIYEVLVRRSPDASEVSIADVGFGISQLLPVLVLCYYVPEHSTIILEHPAIHLHPSAQAGLADVFIDAIKTRNIQIILESHSEHLLRRLQRRVAEEHLGNENTALYFCNTNERGVSQLTSLEMDEFGNIKNWPQDFFGNEIGELAAKTEAEMKRRMELEV